MKVEPSSNNKCRPSLKESMFTCEDRHCTVYYIIRNESIWFLLILVIIVSWPQINVLISTTSNID